MENENMIVSASCSEFEAELNLYLDGELEPRACLRIERHLASCAGCRDLLEDLSTIVETARTLGEMPVPCDVSKRLRAKLNEELGCRFSEVPKLTLVK